MDTEKILYIANQKLWSDDALSYVGTIEQWENDKSVSSALESWWQNECISRDENGEKGQTLGEYREFMFDQGLKCVTESESKCYEPLDDC